VNTADEGERPNSALVRVEPSATQVAAGDVVSLDITVANWTADSPLIPVEAIIDGTSSVATEIALAPYSSGRVTLEFTAPGEGRHAIEVRTPDDGLAVDNHHFLTLEVRQREEVLLLSDTNPDEGGAVFVAAALNPYDSGAAGAGGGGAFFPRILPTTAVTPAVLSSTKTTPFLPVSDPFNGALKRLTQKANS
jgi:hypothetical protein